VALLSEADIPEDDLAVTGAEGCGAVLGRQVGE
jgi:hypothetical protein